MIEVDRRIDKATIREVLEFNQWVEECSVDHPVNSTFDNILNGLEKIVANKNSSWNGIVKAGMELGDTLASQDTIKPLEKKNILFRGAHKFLMSFGHFYI